MKKLIAISVVFALVAGVAFAVDLGGTVFGHVNVLQGDSGKDGNGDANPVTAGGNMDRLRLEGSGEAGEGNFGGWLRVEAGGFQGLAWWKPIDQFKLQIGKNSDGIWGKEGVTGWMFNQMPYDSGIASGSNNIWGWGETVSNLQTRFAFFNGYESDSAAMEIKPVDMLGINISIPFIAMDGSEAKDVFQATIAQLDLNFDFGNIAITYNGGGGMSGDGALFAYFGGSFGDLGLDVGIAYHMDSGTANPFFAGLGIKYATDAFGIKLRTVLGIPMEDTQDLGVLVDLLPYYAFSDTVSAFLNAGFGLSGPDSTVGWFVNPYLRVGAEWGPTFYAGIKISSDGVKGADDKTVVKFAVPISLMVSF